MHNTRNTQPAFQAFITAHGRRYATHSEVAGRFSIFKDNARMIKERNAKGAETHGINRSAPSPVWGWVGLGCYLCIIVVPPIAASVCAFVASAAVASASVAPAASAAPAITHPQTCI